MHQLALFSRLGHKVAPVAMLSPWKSHAGELLILFQMNSNASFMRRSCSAFMGIVSISAYALTTSVRLGRGKRKRSVAKCDRNVASFSRETSLRISVARDELRLGALLPRPASSASLSLRRFGCVLGQRSMPPFSNHVAIKSLSSLSVEQCS